MKRFRDWDNISDDEIRIVGVHRITKPRRPRWGIVLLTILALSGLIALIIFLTNRTQSQSISEKHDRIEYVEQPVIMDNAPIGVADNSLASNEFSEEKGFCEVRDTVINNLSLQLYVPRNARPLLHKGKLNKADSTIVYVSMAADVRADNGEILGAFVLNGEPLAWGLSKKGYCAIIEDVVTVGVADNSPLFERATETEGYFFRQYPLVDNGKLVENKANAYNYLRALCQKDEKTFMVHCNTKVSFHDFAQSLIDLGCDNAIYLIGYEAHGWAVDEDGTTHEFGTEGYFDDKVLIPENLNYIVWRR